MYRVYLKLINRYGFLIYLFQKLEDFWNTIFLLLGNYRSCNTPWRKNSISDLSKLTRCEVSWRVESANVRKLLASFESHERDYVWLISLFDYKAMENTKTLLTAVRRIPLRPFYSPINPAKRQSFEKKGKKNANPDFSHFIFPTFVKMRFFSITVRIFSIAGKKQF